MTRPTDRPDEPTILHITHWKAGSQWVSAVLRDVFPDRCARVEPDFSNLRPDPGVIFTPVYLPVHGVKEFMPESASTRRFAVIRDLRDTLVSWYFSVKHSHGRTDTYTDGIVLSYRERFHQCSEEEGLLIAMEERLEPISRIQSSWTRSGELIVRYEQLIADQHEAFCLIFEHCDLDVDPQVRAEAVERHSFQTRTGRKPGQEDVSAHHRKGIAGDWRNHFTTRVADAFKERYGQLLIDTGYEKSMDWSSEVATTPAPART